MNSRPGFLSYGDAGTLQTSSFGRILPIRLPSPDKSKNLNRTRPLRPSFPPISTPTIWKRVSTRPRIGPLDVFTTGVNSCVRATQPDSAAVVTNTAAHNVTRLWRKFEHFIIRSSEYHEPHVPFSPDPGKVEINLFFLFRASTRPGVRDGHIILNQ